MASVGVSQQQLVNGSSADIEKHPGKKSMQYIAALASTLGALAAGAVLGWSSPMNPKLEAGEYGFEVSSSDLDWISSLVTLGAATVCVIIGFPLNTIGRKWTMLGLVVPFVGGWALIIWANSVLMLFIGRFIVGMAGGAFCVTAPTYTSEIAQDSIRGSLGSYFQLLLTVGILFSYVIGAYVDIMVFNLLAAAIPLVFAAVFFFMPESPYFLVSQDKLEEAQKVLVRLRGSDYDTEAELQLLKDKIDEAKQNPISLKESFSTLAAKKAFMITMMLMLFQQLSGINAVIFNSTTIFENAGSTLDSAIATIIIGCMQVGATFVSTLVVDKLGRKILLLFSGFVMAVCAIALGVYFFLQDQGGNEELVEQIGMLPLVSLCIYIVTFSLGYGPIPWMIASELAKPDIKAIVSSSGGTFNWLLAFAVTSTFGPLTNSLGNGPTFWLFAAFNILGFIFVLVVVPETKGKSLDDIQDLLNGKQVSTRSSKQ